MPQTPEPPATDLPGVTVQGQRRPAGSMQPFPAISLPDPLPTSDATIEPDDSTGPSLCDDPEAREEVNADAAAAKFMRMVKAAIIAAGESFADREYGALLVRQADGSIDVVGFAPGPGGGYGPPVDLTGINPADVVGYVHTHPSGGGASVPDWRDVYNYLYNQGTAANGDMRNLRMYVGTEVNQYNSSTRYLHVWKGGDWGSYDQLFEVNQEGEPCPVS